GGGTRRRFFRALGASRFHTSRLAAPPTQSRAIPRVPCLSTRTAYSRQKAKRERAALELRLQKLRAQVSEMDYTIRLTKQTWQPPVVPGLSSPETLRPLPAAHR